MRQLFYLIISLRKDNDQLTACAGWSSPHPHCGCRFGK